MKCDCLVGVSTSYSQRRSCAWLEIFNILLSKALKTYVVVQLITL